MLTTTDFLENFEKECESIHYVEQSYVLEKYTEENLLFFESGNRMNENSIFLFHKDDQIELCIVEDFDSKLCDAFPMLLETDLISSKFDKEYKFYETGFGGILYVKNAYYERFNNELTKIAKENKIDFYDGQPADTFVHGYWITAAKKVI
jgi:hypothetical protein